MSFSVGSSTSCARLSIKLQHCVAALAATMRVYFCCCYTAACKYSMLSKHCLHIASHCKQLNRSLSSQQTAAALTRCAHTQLVSDHLQGGGGGVFGGGGLASTAAQRPLLVILDRTADLVTPLRHTSTYQALLDDVLEHRVNRVTVEIEGKVSAFAIRLLAEQFMRPLAE
jgi:Sec1 family